MIELPRDSRSGDEAGVSVTDRARTAIAATHTSPATTPATIADTLGVPLRTLQRAFAAEGTTVARELRLARAGTAHDLLTGVSTGVNGAAHIARTAGFGSTASMRRALREFTATTPRDETRDAGSVR